MQLHTNANWWGLWWLALAAALLFAATRIPVRRPKGTRHSAAPQSAKPPE